MAAFVLVNGKVTPKAKLLWQKADRVSLLTMLDAWHTGVRRWGEGEGETIQKWGVPFPTL